MSVGTVRILRGPTTVEAETVRGVVSVEMAMFRSDGTRSAAIVSDPSSPAADRGRGFGPGLGRSSG